MDCSSNAVVPLHNLPNLKQGQNHAEAAFTIYGIVLDVKEHILGPKEVAVGNTIVLFAVGSVLIDCCCNCN